MRIRELSLKGALEVTPIQHQDERGTFFESFRAENFERAVGRPLRLQQANCSVSSRGVIRGIHFAELPPSQAKYVSCQRGAVFDVMVDLRLGSPTYGRWEGVVLDDQERRAVFVPEGFGHGFCSLADNSVVTYLCSAPFAPAREHGIQPFDVGLSIPWPEHGIDGAPLQHVLSMKDAQAPSLGDVRARGLLPTMDAWSAFTSGRARVLGERESVTT